LQGLSEKGGPNYLSDFLKVIDTILDLCRILSEFSNVARELPDATKLTSEFESMYYDILSWSVEKKRPGILSALTISDMICHALGLLKSDFVPTELNQMLSDEIDDVVLLVVDAMPLHFRDLFQKHRRLDLQALVGFSVIPSETAPGHVSIFTGLPPSQTHIYSNTLVLENHSVSLTDSSKYRALPEQLQKTCEKTITNRLRKVGIKTTLFVPSNYQKSLLTKIILGGSLEDVEIHVCKGGVDILREATMIPIRNTSKRFYIILDNEIDASQHAGLKRYYYEEKEMERLFHLHSEYFARLTSFLHKIIRNANRRGRRLLTIITADHGVATLKYVNSSFPDLLEECGLGFIGSGGRSVSCPHPTKLRSGIYSKYDLTLFENPQICKRIGLTRQQAQASRLGFASVHTLHGISRGVLVYVLNDEEFDAKRLALMKCDDCGYSDSVIITNYSFCPKCGALNPKISDIGPLKSALLQRAKNLNFHIVFPSEEISSNDSIRIMDPHFIVFPKFDSIISKYPRNPRESIMYLLKFKKKPLPRTDLVEEYLRLNGIDQFNVKTKEDFDQAFQDLINLGHIGIMKGGCIMQRTEEYTGICTVITHGSFSPSETMIPLVLVKNLGVQQ